MGQLLEFAAQCMTGQDYPCKLCPTKCTNLYAVKIHILECHEDFVGDQKDEAVKDEVVKDTKENVLKVKRKFGKKHRRQKRITHSKKPWCNFCWIKFKNTQEYSEHRVICPNKPSSSSEHAVGHIIDGPVGVTCKNPVKIETKVDEGNEITDIHRTYSDVQPKISTNMKTSKLNMVKTKHESDEKMQLEESEDEDMEITLDHDAMDEAESDDLSETADVCRGKSTLSDPDHFGEDDGEEELLPASPAKSEDDWRERDKERRQQCDVPIRAVKVIMPERVERSMDLDTSGTYTLSELDQLGLSIQEFAADTSCEPEITTESPILSKLLDKPMSALARVPGRDKADLNCSLCTSTAPNLLEHVTEYHKLSKESYLAVFPGDAAKLEVRKWQEPAKVFGAIRVKPESRLHSGLTAPRVTPTAPDTPVNSALQSHKGGRVWSGRPWYESVKTTCMICSKKFWHGQFVKHVKYEHATPLKQYKDLFPEVVIETGQYQCLVCNAYVAHYSSPISGHLTSKHSMTITEYYEIYERFRERNEKGELLMKKKADEKVKASKTSASPQVPVPIKVEPDIGEMMATMEADNQPPVEEKKFRCKICNQLVALTKESITEHMQVVHGSLQVQEPAPKLELAPQEEPEDPNAPNAPWYNRCTWTCLLCSKTFCSGFWKHVNEKHFLKKEDYLRDYGKQGIRIVHYYCRICDKKIPWSGASINAHTKATHCLSLKEYESIYGPQARKGQATSVGDQEELVHGMASGSHQTSRNLAKPAPLPHLLQHVQIQQQQIEQQLHQHQTVQYQGHQQPDKWFNGCEYTCQICFRALHSVAGLSMHLKDTHGMEKLDYFQKFGRDGIKVRKYTCKICTKEFPWSGVSISKHLTQAHGMSLKDYSKRYESGRSFTHGAADLGHSSSQALIMKHSTIDKLARGEGFESISRLGPQGLKKTDRWYNKCSWNCQLCGRHFKTNASSMFKHVTQDHKVSVEEYKERFGNTGTVFVDHKCKLCFKKVPCNGLAMCKHFKHSHSLTLEEYERLYMVGDDGTADSASYEPTQDHWYNKCVWKCQICGKDNKSQGSSKKHVAQMHKITYEEYFELFGNQGITEVPWECNICQISVSCNGVSIASHLNGLHKVTLQEYEALYLKGVPGEVAGQPEEGAASQAVHIGLDLDEDSVVSIDDISILESDPLISGHPEPTGFDPLADIAIENVVSIDDPDFAFVSEHDANQEVEGTETESAKMLRTSTMLPSMDTQGATVIHDVNILEDTKPVVPKNPDFP